jgi:hypothetical protein
MYVNTMVAAAEEEEDKKSSDQQCPKCVCVCVLLSLAEEYKNARPESESNEASEAIAGVV